MTALDVITWALLTAAVTFNIIVWPGIYEEHP